MNYIIQHQKSQLYFKSFEFGSSWVTNTKDAQEFKYQFDAEICVDVLSSKNLMNGFNIIVPPHLIYPQMDIDIALNRVKEILIAVSDVYMDFHLDARDREALRFVIEYVDGRK